ncbi:hypothetical protein [Sulfitobacter sp. SK012]|nr:hypothetical protein [Sulfitobacter sp. SK012]
MKLLTAIQAIALILLAVIGASDIANPAKAQVVDCTVSDTCAN